jgi:hypothetical protein
MNQPMTTLQIHEEYDQNEAFLAALALAEIIPVSALLYSRPSTPTGETATAMPCSSANQSALPCASGSQPVVEACADDTRVLTAEEQEQANINFMVSMYSHERQFLDDHKVKRPNVPLTTARRAHIKRDTFIVAEFELSSHGDDFDEAGNQKKYKGCREARNVREHYNARKAERRSNAARLLA